MRRIMNKKGIGARPLWTGIMLLGLLALALFNFITSFTTSNAQANSIVDSDYNNTRTILNNNITGLDVSAQSFYNTLSSDKPSPVFIFLILGTIVTLPFQIFLGAISVMKILIGFVFTSLLGPEFAIVLAVVTGIIMIAIIYAIIKLIRIGEAER